MSSFIRSRFRVLALAATVALTSATPGVAGERWQHRGGWQGGHERHDWGHGGGGGRGGFGVGGALLGLGIGAALGAAIVRAPPPVYYQPPPAYYGPPPAVYYGY